MAAHTQTMLGRAEKIGSEQVRMGNANAEWDTSEKRKGVHEKKRHGRGAGHMGSTAKRGPRVG